MSDFLNEQEQVDLIKSLWKKYGLSLILLFIVAVAGLFSWQYWQKRSEGIKNGASVDYQYLLQQSQAGNTDAVVKIAHHLMQSYPDTPYSGMAALFVAQKNITDKNYKEADKNLTFAMNHLKSPLNAVAILRLARVKMAQKEWADALVLLSNPSEGFEPEFFMLQGDVYVAEKNNEQAKKAYQSALSALEVKRALLSDSAQSKDKAQDQSQEQSQEQDKTQNSKEKIALKSLIQLKLNAIISSNS